jgi:hypothetical protein
MGRYSELLRLEAEAHEAATCATISGLDYDGLVEWCRNYIQSHKALMLRMRLNLTAVIAHGAAREDQEIALERAREDEHWCKALIEVARDRRMKGEAIPEAWRDYVLDILLMAEKMPDGRGKWTQSVRDEAICRCIHDIVKHTRFKATRQEDNERKCAVDIVVAALGNDPGFHRVRQIWKERPRQVPLLPVVRQE